MYDILTFSYTHSLFIFLYFIYEFIHNHDLLYHSHYLWLFMTFLHNYFYLNYQVILENLQAFQRTLAEIERCRDGLGLPPGAELSLLVFPRAEQLHPHINELQQLTEEQSNAFRVCIILPNNHFMWFRACQTL